MDYHTKFTTYTDHELVSYLRTRDFGGDEAVLELLGRFERVVAARGRRYRPTSGRADQFFNGNNEVEAL